MTLILALCPGNERWMSLIVASFPGNEGLPALILASCPGNEGLPALILENYTLRIGFDDRLLREIDLEPILAGEIYGPLRDRALFERVEVDPEVHTIVWPNGADFDPATLHDWPQHEAAMIALTRR